VVSISAQVHRTLQDCGINVDPFFDINFCSELDFELDFSLYEVFNYLVESQSGYDRRKLKGYKAFDEYRLYADGHIANLEVNRMTPEKIVFWALVKPTQKDLTYLRKDGYKLWIVIESSTGSVSAAYCQCIGG